jgi:sulfur relay (sulfurtransferase) DsrC/TusE family protein
MSQDNRLRVDKSMLKIIRMIQAKYLLQGKTPPSTRRITEMMAKEISEDKVLKKIFIKF